MRFARVADNGLVAEVMDLPDHLELERLGMGVTLVPVPDNLRQTLRERWTWDGKTFQPPSDPAELLVREAAQKKKGRQAIGFTFAEKRIEATAESLAAISSLRRSMEEGALGDGPVAFKTKSGFTRLNTDQVTLLHQQTQMYFQKCIDVELACLEQIERGELRNLDDVNAFFDRELPVPPTG